MRLTSQPEVQSIRNKATVVLHRSEESGVGPIELTVTALPPDYDQELEREIPSPRPKRVGVERENGKVLTDRAGRPVPRYDEEDPEYQRKVRETNSLQLVKTAVDALGAGQIEFDAEKGDDPVSYYRAVRNELKEFGFHFGDILRIARAAQEISGITDEDLEAATADFSKAEN